MRSVLVVDDEPFVRLSLASLCNWHEHGYSFDCEASDGEEALRLIEENTVDVVLLDISMPGMDGIEFLRRLAACTRKPAVVVLSAYGDYRRVREAFTLGAVDYLLKSDMDETTVKAALDKAMYTRQDAGHEGPGLERREIEFLKVRLLRDLLQGGPTEELARSLAGLGMDAAPPFCVCSFWIDDFGSVTARWGADGLARFAEMALRLFGQVLSKRGAGDVVPIRDGHVAVLFSPPENAREFCTDAVEYFDRYLGAGLSWTVGPACLSAADAASSYATATAARFVESRIVRIAKRIVRERFADSEFSLEEASSKAGVSKNHLSYEFSRETGRTFTEYLATVRIEEAKRLLSTTDLMIYEVCERVGYPNVEHFSRTFKRLVGQSPARYKRTSGTNYP